MALKDSFPARMLLRPEAAFADIAAGKAGWAWPLGLYAASMAASALLFKLLPPQYIAESFENFTFTRGRGFLFYFLASLGGGLAISALTCAILSALARFLRGGRLSLRIIAAALVAGAFGVLAAAMHGAAGCRPYGLAAAAAAGAFAAWAAYSGRELYPSLLKALLATSILALAGDLAAGAAALAGSVRLYAAAEYFFSLLSLVWLSKAVSAICGAAKARAAAAVVLAALAGLAFLFLVFNLGLLPPDYFEALLLV